MQNVGLNRSKSLQIKIKVYETRKPGKCYTKLDVQNKFPKLEKKKKLKQVKQQG